MLEVSPKAAKPIKAIFNRQGLDVGLQFARRLLAQKHAEGSKRPYAPATRSAHAKLLAGQLRV